MPVRQIMKRSNLIDLLHTYSGENKVYCYYRMSGTKGEMVEYLRCDAGRNRPYPKHVCAPDAGLEGCSRVPPFIRYGLTGLSPSIP